MCENITFFLRVKTCFRIQNITSDDFQIKEEDAVFEFCNIVALLFWKGKKVMFWLLQHYCFEKKTRVALEFAGLFLKKKWWCFVLWKEKTCCFGVCRIISLKKVVMFWNHVMFLMKYIWFFFLSKIDICGK